MKVGDLVKVHPGPNRLYLIVDDCDIPGIGGEKRWMLYCHKSGRVEAICESFMRVTIEA